MLNKLINIPITTCMLLLLSIGILVIYSSSKTLAFQQLIFAGAGISLFIFISQLSYIELKNIVKGSYIIILILLILVLFVGFETRGSIRWIPLGFINLQPSEFAKPVIILFLASFWEKAKGSWVSILKSMLILFPVVFLVFEQPDLGTTLTISAVWFGIVFASRVSLKKIVLVLILVSLLIPLFWFTLQDYQKSRITSFLEPRNDPLGVGYNLIQSTIAVGSGQFLGRGLGYGTQSRLQFLPEYRTDFIFAAIGEEFGFFGTTLIIGIYSFLIGYCLKIASSADYLGSLLTCGVAVMLIFQIIVNIGMNIGLLPITGITLPLISYGGSSLISTMISLGLVASVAKVKRANKI
ncbi:rod shape-determining protein RodA [Candidatus Daviesbacteria bacterium RIFCSPHIGHO2_12_FULL_37_11]|uniref:Rod shape-determining protein RodA n=1 Tax=Candidatus Daviesbacteria bacterium RIFCSPHIGHO2_12_FULL_37_11 TaxID=1797777 RepID=A0A1F5KE94_9BACT|nr:MAG: rod shape-determining protein RodA [Candidatus Daviesbacteria bacterium GWA1_38_6]OGE18117.1 MAG: rod shape-determining protein RodA [Candidatus Daviesbacteria bacterium RIFCSPHIGHO2_01_FULL_37_27]OGE39263.1 MAG: rod shape-determining protein RodA [Candidatus Daviesbacteria bacterium RIFCSPHIGHO2_12_FULL_37_11]OGE45619.1 MAG: rod shape-determining protein RodA [Candidatus Daviesbacteria bacterium RIFCSPLOWO2_01_FULL_37_10]